MALSGKRIFITGGAGFIGTTLARRLIDANEIVALDNLHRDALTGTDLVEHLAHAYHDELGLPTVTVHPFNIYGPGQIGGGAIRAFIEAALAGRDLTIHGDGSQIRAWCYVDDMVDATLLCLARPEAIGQTFNVGNRRSTVTIYDLAQRVKRLTGAP